MPLCRSSQTLILSIVLFLALSSIQSFILNKSTTQTNSKQLRFLKLFLNRIFCTDLEIHQPLSNDDELVVYFNHNDNRYKHITKILRLDVGDTFKSGVLNVGVTNNASVVEISDSKMKISLGYLNDLISNERPQIDLILAIPRPLRLERILSVVSCLGVGKLVLTGANKVQNDYFGKSTAFNGSNYLTIKCGIYYILLYLGSHLLRKPEQLQECLVEGLSQASCDCMIPEIIVRKDFRKFAVNELKVLFPTSEYHCMVAHPPSDTIDITPKRICEIVANNQHTIDMNNNNDGIVNNKPVTGKRIVIAVGPEGGWEDEEVTLLIEAGFDLITLGPRILRTDMAVSKDE